MKNKIIQKICVWFGACLLVVAMVMLLILQWTIHHSQQQTKEYVSVIRNSIAESQGAVLEERLDNTMPNLSINDTDFIGVLEFPRFQSALPICAKWKSIYKYPCRFGGSVYDSTMQIGATSQKGQYDFYQDISVGDSVTFTDMEGNCYSYAVTNVRYVKSVDETALHQEDASLTLFIKNIYAFEYVIIYCDVLS